MSCCKDVMDPVQASSCCTPRDTAVQAARALRDSGCGCAPVVEDAESLKLVGVVTEHGVCCDVAAEDHHASDVRVADIMQPLSAHCDADAPVEEVRRKLHELRATSLPVVDKAGCCCGTVSFRGIERARVAP